MDWDEKILNVSLNAQAVIEIFIFFGTEFDCYFL